MHKLARIFMDAVIQTSFNLTLYYIDCSMDIVCVPSRHGIAYDVSDAWWLCRGDVRFFSFSCCHSKWKFFMTFCVVVVVAVCYFGLSIGMHTIVVVSKRTGRNYREKRSMWSLIGVWLLLLVEKQPVTMHFGRCGFRIRRSVVLHIWDSNCSRDRGIIFGSPRYHCDRKTQTFAS